MDIKQEDLIRFWTWCGFARDGVGIWHCPNKIDELGKAIPKLDLNNLYRYAIPKLQKEHRHIKIIILEDTVIVQIERDWMSKPDCEIISKDLTEALYNAIMKVIEKDV